MIKPNKSLGKGLPPAEAAEALKNLQKRREGEMADALAGRGAGKRLGRPPTTRELRTPLGLQITVSLRQRIDRVVADTGKPLVAVVTSALLKGLPHER